MFSGAMRFAPSVGVGIVVCGILVCGSVLSVPLVNGPVNALVLGKSMDRRIGIRSLVTNMVTLGRVTLGCTFTRVLEDEDVEVDGFVFDVARW